jgi:transcription elongation factor Elf1
VRLYLDIEAKVMPESMGDAANIVCSIARAMEHLLKLRLLRLDPILLYPMPMSLELYAAVKGIPYHADKALQDIGTTHTVGFTEALRRVEATTTTGRKQLQAFRRVRHLRDMLEHHWDNNADYLAGIVGEMSTQILPSLQAFICEILEEEPGVYLDPNMLEEVARLDRALVENHSLALQRRIDTMTRDWQISHSECARLHSIPAQYENLDVVSIDTECPICGQTMLVRWALEDIEAYEVAPDGTRTPFILSGEPEPECAFCSQCGFHADGRDLAGYVPASIDYYDNSVSAYIFEQIQAEEQQQEREEDDRE